MKIVKSVILASALCVSAFSLFGYFQVAHSAPAKPELTYAEEKGLYMESLRKASATPFATPAKYFKSRIGQKCEINPKWSSESARRDQGIVGTLVSFDDDWIVVGGIVQDATGNGGNLETYEVCFPTSSISSIKFVTIVINNNRGRFSEE